MIDKFTFVWDFLPLFIFFEKGRWTLIEFWLVNSIIMLQDRSLYGGVNDEDKQKRGGFVAKLHFAWSNLAPMATFLHSGEHKQLPSLKINLVTIVEFYDKVGYVKIQ